VGISASSPAIDTGGARIATMLRPRPSREPFDSPVLRVLGRCYISTAPPVGGRRSPVAAIESSRIRRTLLVCVLGSTLPVLCLAQTTGLPPLPPLKGTAPLAAAAD